MTRFKHASWLRLANAQPVGYQDPAALQEALTQLQVALPLVEYQKIERLKNRLIEAYQGERVLLHAGYCAERFQDCEPQAVALQAQLLTTLGEKLATAVDQPVTVIGRFAGQFAKPRSEFTEVVDGVEMPSYRGDLINDIRATLQDREPNPERLLLAYQAASQGFKTINAQFPALFASHEALNLYYEQALTQQVADGMTYNLSTHLPWIGVRTNQADGAHIEYASTIANPIAVKIGVNTSPAKIRALAEKLNPNRDLGRLIFIHRLGCRHIEGELPALLETLRRSEMPALWLCDPMHGNTRRVTGVKTRRFDDIVSELNLAHIVHAENNSRLHGLHFEVLPYPVTEVLGGPEHIQPTQLNQNYRSYLDPCLNPTQATELVQCFSTLAAEMAV